MSRATAIASVSNDEPPGTPSRERNGEPPPPITLSVMQLVAATYARDIEDDQARWVGNGIRTAPDPCKLEEARVLRKIAELLERLRGSKEAMALLGFKARPSGGNS